MIYTQEKAQRVLHFFKDAISKRSKLIGSHSKGKESSHDIDIYLPCIKRTDKTIRKIAHLLRAKKYETTDWGGVYYTNTSFGDIDVFFKGNTKEFTH